MTTPSLHSGAEGSGLESRTGWKSIIRSSVRYTPVALHWGSTYWIVLMSAGIGGQQASVMSAVQNLLLATIPGTLLAPILGPWIDRTKARFTGWLAVATVALAILILSFSHQNLYVSRVLLVGLSLMSGLLLSSLIKLNLYPDQEVGQRSQHVLVAILFGTLFAGLLSAYLYIPPYVIVMLNLPFILLCWRRSNSTGSEPPFGEAKTTPTQSQHTENNHLQESPWYLSVFKDRQGLIWGMRFVSVQSMFQSIYLVAIAASIVHNHSLEFIHDDDISASLLQSCVSIGLIIGGFLSLYSAVRLAGVNVLIITTLMVASVWAFFVAPSVVGLPAFMVMHVLFEWLWLKSASGCISAAHSSRIAMVTLLSRGAASLGMAGVALAFALIMEHSSLVYALLAWTCVIALVTIAIESVALSLGKHTSDGFYKKEDLHARTT